jgi:hypothetical protein
MDNDDDDQLIDPRLWSSVCTVPAPVTNHPAGNNPPIVAASVAAAPVAANPANTPATVDGTPPPPSPSVAQAAPRRKPAKKSSGQRWTVEEIQALRERHADPGWKYRRMIVSSALFSCRYVRLFTYEPLAPGDMVACSDPADPVSDV